MHTLKYNQETLLQRHLEAWNDHYRQIRPGDDEVIGTAEMRRIYVQASVMAGWVDGIDDPLAVFDMTVADVLELSKATNTLWSWANDISPNS